MADILDAITKLIQSPPGQLAAGAVLAGIVWKFFERVEAVLTENTKLEIAVWLLGVKVGQKVEPWPETFAKVFDRVFGKRHLSWKCFVRSCAASSSAYGLGVLVSVLGYRDQNWRLIFTSGLALVVTAIWLGSLIVDYVSLLKARWLIGWRRLEASHHMFDIWWAVVILDFSFTCVIGFCYLLVSIAMFHVAEMFVRWNTVLSAEQFLVDIRQFLLFFLHHPKSAFNWNIKADLCTQIRSAEAD